MAANLKYVRNFSTTGEEVDILLYSGVNEYTVNDFLSEFRYLESAGVKVINVRINSAGGSVLFGNAIIAAMLNSSATVNTVVDGIAASMAAVIAAVGKTRSMADYARLMTHEASFGDEPLDQNQKAALLQMNGSLVSILASKTGKTEEYVIANWMKPGIDTWFTPDEAVAAGIADKVISMPGKKRPKLNASASLEEICNSYNEVLQNQETNMSLTKVCAALKLDSATDEATVLAKVNDLVKDLAGAQAKVTGLETQIETQKGEIETANATIQGYVTKEKEAQKTACIKLVQDAITAKKIAKTSEANWLQLAENNYDATAEALKNLTPNLKISQIIEKEGEKTEDVNKLSPMNARLKAIEEKTKRK